MPLFPPNLGSGQLQCLNVKLLSDTTTTSATYVNLLTLTIGTIGGTYLLIRASYSTLDTTSTSDRNFYRVTVGGTVYGYAGNEIFTGPQSGAICVRTGSLTRGSYVVNLDWHTTGANTLQCRPTATANYEHASLIVTEVTV